jgi:hypothetical protein
MPLVFVSLFNMVLTGWGGFWLRVGLEVLRVGVGNYAAGWPDFCLTLMLHCGRTRRFVA